MRQLDCRDAESMVNRYINHDLSVDELEVFLDHIEHCPSCYDELETYFIVSEALHQLDETRPYDGSVQDFKKLLQLDLNKSHHYINKQRIVHMAIGVGILLIAAALAIFILLLFKI